MTKREYDGLNRGDRVMYHCGNQEKVCQVMSKAKGKLTVFVVGRPDMGTREARYQSCRKLLPDNGPFETWGQL